MRTTSTPQVPAPLSRTLSLTRTAAARIALATVLGAAAVAADIGLIGTAAWLISRAAEHPNESALALAIVAVQVFGLTRGLLRYGERLVGHDAAFRLLADVRVRVYRRLEGLAPAGLPAFQRGDLLARLVADVDSLQDVVLRVIPSFGISLLVGALAVAVTWWMLPAAGAILAVALVFAGTVIPWLTGHLARRKESRFAVARGELAASVVDLTEGAAELVVFGAAGPQLKTVREHDRELTAIATASAGTAGTGLALMTLLSGLTCWGCLLVGIPAVLSGQLDETQLAVITLIPLAAFDAVVGLPVASQSLQRVRQAAARVFEVLDAPVPVAEPNTAAARPCPPYPLAARSVWATYPDAAGPALRGANLTLTAGRRVAIVGPSGAGKSTLAMVLLRLVEFQSGSVTLDARPIADVAGADVRSVIGLVGQDGYLFDTSVRANLAIGKPDATGEQMQAALARVGLSGWLDALPAGLSTEVGRQGMRLSGGQRQRVGVARALLADFPILVLDEPTEHLDRAAADALSADLLEVTGGRCTLLITHRLRGLESLDEILFLDEGRVVERGTHDELLDHGGRYAALWSDERQADLISDGSRS